MYIANELIENLRTALTDYAKHGDVVRLVSIATEIADQIPPEITEDQAEAAGRLTDRDGDTWYRFGNSNHWCLNPGCAGPDSHHGLPLDVIVGSYYPIRAAADE